MADINTDQKFPTATLVITNDAGEPATVDGAPVWASSDETVVSVVAAEDGLSADISAVAPGTARVTVTADADMGAGVTEITGVTEDIVVTAGPSSFATNIGITLGEPEPKAA